MDIKEIVAKEAKDKCTRYHHNAVAGACSFEFRLFDLIDFSEALIAELAKGNEPVAFTNSCELDYLDFKRADSGLVSAAMWKDYDKDSDIALYTLPPAAYQIEQETAEACAKYVYSTKGIKGVTNMAESILNGAWKEFKKS